MIHVREAHAPLLAVLKAEGGLYRGVLHCFSGSKEMAREYLDLNLHLAVGGPVTFKNARKLPEVIKQSPGSVITGDRCALFDPPSLAGKAKRTGLFDGRCQPGRSRARTRAGGGGGIDVEERGGLFGVASRSVMVLSLMKKKGARRLCRVPCFQPRLEYGI